MQYFELGEYWLDIIYSEDLNMVKYLFKLYSYYNLKIDWLQLVSTTVMVGCRSILEFFNEQGVNLNDEKFDALSMAAKYGNIEILEYLLDNGTNIHQKNDKALRTALCNGEVEMAKYLISKNADVLQIDSLVFHCAVVHDYLNAVIFIMDNCDHLNMNRPCILYTEIMSAAAYGRLNVLKYLLPKGELTAVDAAWALWEAVMSNNEDVIKFMLSIGVNINYAGSEIFSSSIENDDLSMIKVLVDIGADIHMEKEYLLCESVDYGHADIVEYLIDAGANVFVNNDYPLHSAIKNGNLPIVKCLLSKTNYSKEQLDLAHKLACEMSRNDTVDLISSHKN